MDSLRFTTRTASDGVVERDFAVGGVPGVLWTPQDPAGPTPLVLMGHGGGLHKRTPPQVARARHAVIRWGHAVAALDAPGHGDRPRGARDEQVRADLRRAMATGDHHAVREISAAYGEALAGQAVPEWRAVVDALLDLPEFGAATPVGYGGGITLGTAIGIPLVAADPRIVAAVFGGGFVVTDAVLAAARRITVPVQFLLPWDDEHADRASSLGLFDAFASAGKTLHAQPGDHRTIRWAGVDDTFLARHLGTPVPA